MLTMKKAMDKPKLSTIDPIREEVLTIEEEREKSKIEPKSMPRRLILRLMARNTAGK